MLIDPPLVGFLGLVTGRKAPFKGLGQEISAPAAAAYALMKILQAVSTAAQHCNRDIRRRLEGRLDHTEPRRKDT